MFPYKSIFVFKSEARTGAATLDARQASDPKPLGQASDPKPLGVEGHCWSLYLKSPKLAEKLSRLTNKNTKTHKVTQEKAKTKKSNVFSCWQGSHLSLARSGNAFLIFLLFFSRAKILIAAFTFIMINGLKFKYRKFHRHPPLLTATAEWMVEPAAEYHGKAKKSRKSN